MSFNFKRMKNSSAYLSGLITTVLILLPAAVLLASDEDTCRIKLVFAGDIMGHDTQINAAYDPYSNRYDYHECFSLIKPYLKVADIAIGNLEVTLAGEPYKGYPQFSSPDALADAIREAGFDVLVNANNHALDRGKEGLERTLDVLSDNGLIITGSFRSKEHRDLQYPLLIEKNNIFLAILNYTYGTNGLIADTPNIVNYIDTLLIKEDIEKVNAVQPDFVIACIHWGREYERNEHSSQQDLAKFFFRQGVDAIIGSHPHVVQPVKVHYPHADSSHYKLVVYSLGNLVSNQRNRYRDGGILFELNLEKTDRTIIRDYSYTPVWVNKPEVNGKTIFQLVPAGISQSAVDSLNFSEASLEKFTEFYKDTKEHLRDVPENHFYSDYSLE
jgi:poly-gamma-glutamate capsule biosynthesis protein CapA/YwtB (metallophosphatase superfamily)